MDWEAFMNPSGGTGWGERSYGMQALLSGLGIDLAASFLLSDTMINKDIRKEAKNIVSPVKGSILENRLKINRERTKIFKAQARAQGITGPLTKSGPLWATVSKNMRHTPASSMIDAREKLVRQTATSIRTNIRNIKSNTRSSRNTLKMLGWMFAASSLIDLGISATTPSVALSASAQRAESNFFNRPLDSGMAATQRQRAIMAIHDSQLATTPILGSEAMYMHR